MLRFNSAAYGDIYRVTENSNFKDKGEVINLKTAWICAETVTNTVKCVIIARILAS